MLGWHIVPTGFVPCLLWGKGRRLFPSLYKHGKWVHDVNILIITETA
jgi:hypothetical protein